MGRLGGGKLVGWTHAPYEKVMMEERRADNLRREKEDLEAKLQDVAAKLARVEETVGTLEVG